MVLQQLDAQLVQTVARPPRDRNVRAEDRLRAEAGRAHAPFETICPLTAPPDVELLRRLEGEGMTSATAWPFSYTLGPDASLAQKRDALLRLGETVIAKLRQP